MPLQGPENAMPMWRFNSSSAHMPIGITINHLFIQFIILQNDNNKLGYRLRRLSVVRVWVCGDRRRRVCVQICVLDQANELRSSGPLLGCCVVGPREQQGPDRDHWTEMSQTPRKAVAMWHTLR